MKKSLIGKKMKILFFLTLLLLAINLFSQNYKIIRENPFDSQIYNDASNYRYEFNMDAEWEDNIDIDGDGYTRYRTLIISIDDDGNNEIHFIERLEVEYRENGSSNGTNYINIDYFYFVGSVTVEIYIGEGFTELPHNIYDWYIRADEVGGSYWGSVLWNTDSDCDNQYFETSSQDPSNIHIVIYPNSNSFWLPNNEYDIIWETSADGPTAQFVLEQGVTNELIEVIDLSAPNNGHYSWSIPSYIPTGQNYKIRVYVWHWDPHVAIEIVSQYFSIINDPPELILPEHFQIVMNPVLFSWESLIGADSYEIWIDNELVSTLYSTFYTTSLENGTHIWKVRASYGNLNTPFSNTRTVAIDNVSTQDIALESESEILLNCYPNPFNPETNILFELSFNSNVLLEIYNIKGQKVTTLVNGPFEAGSHKVTWNATDQSSGIYLLRFNTAETSEMKKLILLK